MGISAGADGDRTKRGAAIAGAPSVDLAALRSSLREGGVEDVLETLVASFLHEAPGRVAGIEDAVRAGDAERIRQSAHAYRSSAAQLGARALAEALQALELAGRAGDLAAAAGLVGTVQREHKSVCMYLAGAAAGGE